MSKATHFPTYKSITLFLITVMLAGLVLILSPVQAREVAVPLSRIWDGGGTTQNWSDAANWTSDILPNDSDSVRFDGTSTKQATIDAAFVHTLIDVTIASGYTGQITQNAALEVAGDWSHEDGSFVGGGSTLDINGAFDLSGGSFTAPTGLMSVGGGFHHTGGTFDPNGGRVVVDNTSDQVLATAFHDLYLNDGLLGYWKLDEGSGDITADSSGYGNDGALHNSPVWNANIPSTMDYEDTYSLGFNRTGETEYVMMSDTTQIDEAKELTLSTWVRLDSTPFWAFMRFISLGNEKAVLRYWDNNGTPNVHFYMSIGGTLRGILVNHAWAIDTWYHVAGTYDGSTMRLYLDGLELDTYDISGTADAGNGVILSRTSNSEALDGLLDDVRVYDRALSAAEIGDLADGKHPQTSIATNTLGAALDVDGDLVLNSGMLGQPQTMGYWNMDEGSGTTAADSSVNGYDGTLQPSPTWSTDTPVTHFSNLTSLSFDRADNDYVRIPGTPNIDNLQHFTLATWVKLNSTPGGNMRFITLGIEKAVLRYDDDALHFYVKIDGALHGILAIDALSSSGSWLHAAGTYDGEDMRLYLNGVEQSSLSVSGAVFVGDGVHLSSSGETLDGLLDDVRVFGRALSATEIKALAEGYDVRSQDISIGGDFVRNGGVFEHGSGRVTFDGSGAQNLDTDAVTLYDMTVEAGATVDLGPKTMLSVDGTLTNNGALKQTRVVDASSTEFLNIKDSDGVVNKYYGVEIDPGASDMGSTDVTVWGNQLCPNAVNGVQRCFELEPTTPQPSIVRFYYTEAERNGEENDSMEVLHWNSASWDIEDGSYGRGGAGAAQWVQVTGVDEYSTFRLGHETRIYLPVVLKDSCFGFVGLDEGEDNDTFADASGPLCFGREYVGQPDNDGPVENDFFYVDWDGAGTLTVDVHTLHVEGIKGQIILYDASETFVDHVYAATDGHYHLFYSGLAGRYYIRVFLDTGHGATGEYTLTVTE
jgi:hypothetical protein